MTTTARRLALRLAPLVLLGACSRVEPEPKPEPRKDPTPAAAASSAAAAAFSVAAAPTPPGSAGAAMQGPLVLARGVRIVHAPSGEVASVVKAEREKAKSDGRDLVVYVGATWCEPCKHFHKAAQAGLLDADFPNLTLLEFDLDEDRDRLASAGYLSQYIPLFAMPASDGRASDKKFEGAIKGDGAVKHITPRLRSLLAR
ncbi:MAG: thioredoxin family protein [Deltaproteobacteria bacterium]|nr:thioredoxin family protein [Deltaproteobacteria bacterium]